MEVKVHVSQAELDSIAAKLEQFSSLLSEREQHILLGVFDLAGDAMRASIGVVAAAPTRSSGTATLPSLPDGFREAFHDIAGSSFKFTDSEFEQDNVDSTGAWTKVMHLS